MDLLRAIGITSVIEVSDREQLLRWREECKTPGRFVQKIWTLRNEEQAARNAAARALFGLPHAQDAWTPRPPAPLEAAPPIGMVVGEHSSRPRQAPATVTSIATKRATGKAQR